MFNEIFRQKAMEIIEKHFTHLSQYTKLIRNDRTQCWFLLADGNWNFLNQNEGGMSLQLSIRSLSPAHNHRTNRQIPKRKSTSQKTKWNI